MMEICFAVLQSFERANNLFTVFDIRYVLSVARFCLVPCEVLTKLSKRVKRVERELNRILNNPVNA